MLTFYSAAAGDVGSCTTFPFTTANNLLTGGGISSDDANLSCLT